LLGPGDLSARRNSSRVVHVILRYAVGKSDLLRGKLGESMKPVMTALQTIAAIKSETRELIPEEAASTCPTETVQSQNLGESSLTSSNGRNGPTAPCANSKATAYVNSSGGPLIDQLSTAPETSFACDREIRIDKGDRIALSVSPALKIKGRSAAILLGLSLPCLGLGWIGASSDLFSLNLTSLSLQQGNSSAYPPDPAKSDRLELRSLPTNPTPTATAIARAHEAFKNVAPTTHLVSLPTKQNTSAPRPTGERTKVSARPTPVPETKPTTIDGWTIREVNGGTAVLEGPSGVWKATRGDTVPGVGKIDSIVRWGNRWIVATSKGLISTR
jgi:hypothetical protein